MASLWCIASRCGRPHGQLRRRRHQKDSPTSTGTQAIDRAAELLSRVVLADEKPGFRELVTDTGLAKSTASRLLQALERHRLVHRDDTGGYAAGALFALYASRHEPSTSTSRSRGPRCRSGADATGETVNLAVPRDQHRRAGRADRRDVPPRHGQLGRGRRAAALLRTRQGALRRRAVELARRMTSSAVPTAPSPTFRRPRPTAPRGPGPGYAVTVGELEVGLDAIACHGSRSTRGHRRAGHLRSQPRLDHRLDEIGHLFIDQPRSCPVLGAPARPPPRGRRVRHDARRKFCKRSTTRRWSATVRASSSSREAGLDNGMTPSRCSSTR